MKSTLSSSSQIIPHSSNLRSRPLQTTPSSLARSTSSSISALLRQHAQPRSYTPEKLPSSLSLSLSLSLSFYLSFSDIQLSLRLSSVIETSSTVHSYPKSTHLFGDEESTISLSGKNTANLPYHTPEQTSRPATPDPYHHPPRIDNQKVSHFSQRLKYHIFPVIRINNSLQFSTSTRNQELNRLTQNATEIKFEGSVKFFGVNSHSIPISIQNKHRTFPSPFVWNRLQFASTCDPPFDRQWGSLAFYNPICCLKYKTTF